MESCSITGVEIVISCCGFSGSLKRVVLSGRQNNVEHQKKPPAYVEKSGLISFLSSWENRSACWYLPSLIGSSFGGSASPCEISRIGMHLPVGRDIIFFFFLIYLFHDCCCFCLHAAFFASSLVEPLNPGRWLRANINIKTFISCPAEGTWLRLDHNHLHLAHTGPAGKGGGNSGRFSIHTYLYVHFHYAVPLWRGNLMQSAEKKRNKY